MVFGVGQNPSDLPGPRDSVQLLRPFFRLPKFRRPRFSFKRPLQTVTLWEGQSGFTVTLCEGQSEKTVTVSKKTEIGQVILYNIWYTKLMGV